MPPSVFPVEAKIKVDKGGQLIKKSAFYVRIGNGTREITDVAEKQKYLSGRWATATIHRVLTVSELALHDSGCSDPPCLLWRSWVADYQLGDEFQAPGSKTVMMAGRWRRRLLVR